MPSLVVAAFAAAAAGAILPVVACSACSSNGSVPPGAAPDATAGDDGPASDGWIFEGPPDAGSTPDAPPEAEAAAYSLPDGCGPSVTPAAGCASPVVVSSCDAGWCFVPHGCFIMGSPKCEFDRGLYDEDQVQVTLTHDFEMQQTETTQAQWSSLGFANPSAQKDAGFMGGGWGDGHDPQAPVGNVMLVDAMAAANLMSDRHSPPLPECYVLSGCSGAVGAGMGCSGHALSTPTAYECAGYRLPTEAEWEYAARAGTISPLYSGDVVHTLACAADPNSESIGWFCYNAGGFSQRVAQKLPNGWGLYDMAGNVAEYTSSAFTGTGYGTGPLVDPMGDLAPTGADVVTRGGLANFRASVMRSANRLQIGTYSSTGPLIGFRLVRTVAQADAGVGADR